MRGADGETRAPELRLAAHVDSMVTAYATGDDPQASRFCEYRTALKAVADAVLAYATLTGGLGEVDHLFELGTEVVNRLRWSVEGYDPPEAQKKKLAVWSHRPHLLHDVKTRATPPFVRPELEATVGDYLALPYRVGYLDRILTDVLIALEFYQYADEMLNEHVIPEIAPPKSPFSYRPLKKAIRGQYHWWLLLFLVGILFIGLPYEAHVMSAGFAILSAYVLLGVGLLSFAATVVFLPVSWWYIAKEKSKVTAVFSVMSGVYMQLRSAGPISAQHIRDQLEAACDKGVIWPAPVYALLDDIQSRTGRL